MKKLLVLLFITSFGQITFSQLGVEFVPDCELPFKSIAVKRDIDENCGARGTKLKNNARANQLQNELKNNFCATGEAVQMIVDDFIELHNIVKESGMEYGNSRLVPKDRSVLTELGEGTKVYFEGYIYSARYVNLYHGEGVDCYLKKEENNDIHIEMSDEIGEKEKCKLISAEVSPHFRPDAWTPENLNRAKKEGVKVRITGQLFFDGSHDACPDGNDSFRGSTWEIHPVYRIQVFVEGNWVDIHKWH
ncbi:MAG: hypothetical protein QNK23_00920 [Crocinitomicaceae bacterium]|nr:hypothetical protein [Crocinitomicaceae bacterium]